MDTRRQREVDILATGELLIDFISNNFAKDLNEINDFKRLAGGSPANLCMNMAKLGNNATLVASVGNDDMGHFLLKYVAAQGVDVNLLQQHDLIPTTLILITRSQGVANFEAYRGADCQISDQQFPEVILKNTSIFHTTCFGLSLDPAQSSIMTAARKAVKLGCQLSIDTNYAPKIWPDRTEAQQILSEYIGLGALVKISDVDWERLSHKSLQDPMEVAQHFLQIGAKAVCVTLGPKGSLIADQAGSHFLEAQKVEVKDTTGAGDAFWSGFLTAWLDGHDLLNCGLAGRKMAEIKLGYFGPLPLKVEKRVLFEK